MALASDVEAIQQLNRSVRALAKELARRNRPLVFVEIGPGKTGHINMFMVRVANVGMSTAYDITCQFEPDFPYHGDTTLSQLPVFQRLDYLPPNEELTFFFESAITYLNDPNTPKRTTATLTYRDFDEEQYTDKLVIDLKRFDKLRYPETHDINDLVKQIEDLTRVLERIQRDGLLTKTRQDMEQEMREREEWMRKQREQLSRDRTE